MNVRKVTKQEVKQRKANITKRSENRKIKEVTFFATESSEAIPVLRTERRSQQMKGRTSNINLRGP